MSLANQLKSHYCQNVFTGATILDKTVERVYASLSTTKYISLMQPVLVTLPPPLPLNVAWLAMWSIQYNVTVIKFKA